MNAQAFYMIDFAGQPTGEEFTALIISLGLLTVAILKAKGRI